MRRKPIGRHDQKRCDKYESEDDTSEVEVLEVRQAHNNFRVAARLSLHANTYPGGGEIML